MAKASVTFHDKLLIRLGGVGFALLAVLAMERTAPPTISYAQGTGACDDPAGGPATNYQHAYSLMVSRTDTASARKRAELSLPTLSPNQVVIVSDTAACRRASAAFDSAENVSYPTRPVVVLALGSTRRIVVKKLNFRGPQINLLFDQNFVTVFSRIGL